MAEQVAEIVHFNEERFRLLAYMAKQLYTQSTNRIRDQVE